MDKLIIVGPLPPCESGIAAYSAELSDSLSNHYDLINVCQDDRKHRWHNGRAECVSLDGYSRRVDFSGLPHIYHIGNNKHHAYVYQLAKKRPGIVVVHDPMFFEMVAEAGLNGQEDRFFEPSGGLANLQASLKLAGLHYTPFDVLATRNFLLRQKHAVVLSRSALRLVPLPLSKLTYIPHHAPTRSFSVLNESKLAARAKLNLHANNFYLITMGHPAAHKYLDDSLEAFAELSLIHDHLRYIIIGRMSESSRVIRTISRLGIGAKVLLQGWVSEPEFFLYCRAADLAVNVRNSYRGETSGVLLRTASCGLPSLVGTSGSAAEMPIDKIFRVQLTSRLKIELRHRINYAIINPRILKNEAIRLIALTQFNYSQTFCAQQYVELVDRIYHGGDSDRQMIGYGHS